MTPKLSVAGPPDTSAVPPEFLRWTSKDHHLKACRKRRLHHLLTEVVLLRPERTESARRVHGAGSVAWVEAREVGASERAFPGLTLAKAANSFLLLLVRHLLLVAWHLLLLAWHLLLVADSLCGSCG